VLGFMGGDAAWCRDVFSAEREDEMGNGLAEAVRIRRGCWPGELRAGPTPVFSSSACLDDEAVALGVEDGRM